MFALMKEYATLTMPIEEAVVLDSVLMTARKNPNVHNDYLSSLTALQLTVLKRDLTERITQDFLNLKFVNTLL